MPKPPGSGVSKQAIEEVAVVGNVNVEDLLVGGEDGPLNSPQGKVVDDDGSGCKGGGGGSGCGWWGDGVVVEGVETTSDITQRRRFLFFLVVVGLLACYQSVRGA